MSLTLLYGRSSFFTVLSHLTKLCYRAYLRKVDLLVLCVASVDLAGAAPPASQLQPGERVYATLVCSQS